MKCKVLITGGAGFIGSHLARRLLRDGYDVSILDNFSPQIHGTNSALPSDLADAVQLFRGDVRDAALCESALRGQDALIHLAAETGTGQSMYRVRHYSEVNIGATSTLMELLLTGDFPLKSVVVASSRAIYGEGAACCREHGLVYPLARSVRDMEQGAFEPKCPVCGMDTTMVATREDAPYHPSSFYGITKQVQEQMVLMYTTSLGLNGFALRYQNVYGPGQSLKNPYTGILAVFSNQARENKPINIFEDGQESRDFVYIDDVVEATVRCVSAPAQPPVALNVGTGIPVTVTKVVEGITAFFQSRSEIKVTGAFRQGDIRHCYASTEKLQNTLDFTPTWKFEDGLKEFLRWAASEGLESGRYEESLAEMRRAGLLHG